MRTWRRRVRFPGMNCRLVVADARPTRLIGLGGVSSVFTRA